MNAEDFTVNVDEDRRRNNGQVSFMERTEEDIEEIVEKMQTVPSSRVEESVKGIGDTMNARDESENLDSLLRDTVTVHAQAPIRSTINPDAHTVETESGRELQVAGEEYFLNQNSQALGDFMDVSNVKWYKLEDNGVSTEETRNDRAGEHLRNTATSEYGVEGFHIEVDGQPLDAEEVEAFRRSISRREQATVAPHNEVTGLMMDYDSVLDAVENEDISEQEFNELYYEALSDGLVTEDGDFTLKGWLSAVDLTGPDLRSFEEVARGSDTLETDRDGAFDSIADVREHDTTTSVNLNNVSWAGAWFDFGMEELEQDEARELVSGFGGDFEELREEGEMRLEAKVPEMLNAVLEDEIYGENGFSLEKVGKINTDAVDSLIRKAEGAYNSVEYTEADLVDYEIGLQSEKEGMREAFIEIFEDVHGSYDAMVEEIEENMTMNGLSLDYEGEEAPENIARRLGFISSTRYQDGELEKQSRLNNGLADVMLLPFEEELEEHGYDPTSITSDHLIDYDSISSEIKQLVNRLEDEDLVETTIRETETAQLDLNPETEEDYRLLDRVFSDSDMEFPYEERPLSEGDVEVETVEVNCEIVYDAEDLDEELDEHQEEILQLLGENNNFGDVFTNYGRESILDYKAEGLTEKAHNLVDKSEALQTVRKALIGRPDKEVIGEEIGPDYDDLRFTAPEDERETEYFEDLNRPGSDELVAALEELEDEGLVELEYSTETTEYPGSDAETEVMYYGGTFELENYHELNEQEKEALKELDERGVADLDEGKRELQIEETRDVYFEQKWQAEGTHIDTVFDEDEEERTYEETFDFEHEEVTRYEVNDQVRDIGEVLDPMNFETDPYEEITVENDFSYTATA
jgi:hypothetical protein